MTSESAIKNEQIIFCFRLKGGMPLDIFFLTVVQFVFPISYHCKQTRGAFTLPNTPYSYISCCLGDEVTTDWLLVQIMYFLSYQCVQWLTFKFGVGSKWTPDHYFGVNQRDWFSGRNPNLRTYWESWDWAQSKFSFFLIPMVLSTGQFVKYLFTKDAKSQPLLVTFSI